MHKYKELKIWQNYCITARFFKQEEFGLISQINRASISIRSNIAEGAGRNSVKGFSYFLSIARASSYEVKHN
ncbi:four helix bundle protein [Pedobacter sp.]|uniref:four helix bundle protein n=1 Tax=Pedobacter sp. TaxID=1411316 RepID=UPI00396CDB34